MTRPARVRQAVFDAAMAVDRGSALGSLSFELLLRLARAGRDDGQALVRYELAGRELLIPVTHELPRYRRYSAGYGENVGRIAAAVHSKYPDATAVDIGANVGDSAVLLTREAPVPVLCVEGDPAFARLLRHNVRSLDGAVVVEAFVGAAAGEADVDRRAEGGTLRLDPGRGSTRVRFETLGSILAAHPTFARPRLVKLDTDGLDVPILTAERDLLATLRPAVFFEYAPDFYRDPDEAFRVFDLLAGAGYTRALAYLNQGDFLASADLGERRLLEDLHAFVTGHVDYGEPPPRYLDVCAFHADDADVWEEARRRELALQARAPTPA